MRLERTELRARLLAEAEAAIDRLLAEGSKKEELVLSDVERLVRKAGQRIVERLTAEIVAEEAPRAEDRICPDCGRKMRYKGHKGRDLVTETGELHLERAYYYCESCRKGFFPPRPTMESERDALQPRDGTADGMAKRAAATRARKRGL
jgi:hypothetical protein